MTYLVVSLPKRPSPFATGTRFVYRVVLDSGENITLPELATRLKLPYPPLGAAISQELAEVGEHTTKFLQVLDRVSKTYKSRMQKRKLVPCPHCNGKGTTSQPAKPVEVASV